MDIVTDIIAEEGRIGIQYLHLSDEPTDEKSMLSFSMFGSSSLNTHEQDNQRVEKIYQLDCEQD